MVLLLHTLDHRPRRTVLWLFASDDKEVDVFPAAIVVMVDNLPCELKDASEGFGSMFME
jgi:hypothetical protein